MPPARKTNRFREEDKDVEVAPLVEEEDIEDDTVEEIEEDDSLIEPLTNEARVTVTVGTSFSYRNQTHWPKVQIEDGPFPVVDEDGNPLGWEDTESLFYRVEENAHRRLDAIIARMKRDIDARISADAERVRRERGLPTT